MCCCNAQVLLSPEMGSRTVHFDALRREVQLAARFNSERLVQVIGDPYRSTLAHTHSSTISPQSTPDDRAGKWNVTNWCLHITHIRVM